MTTVALLQDPTGTGGVATLVHWYRLWMERHQPGYTELFLDEHGPGGWRKLRDWSSDCSALPRVMPRLHLPPYWWAARRLQQYGRADYQKVHVVGASIAQGTLLPGRKSVVWFATLFDDERANSMSGRSLSRRVLYSATLRPLGQLEERVLGEADRVLAMSHHTANLVVERGLATSSAVTVVPVPVDTESYRLPVGDDTRRGVLFVGRANDPRKGLGRLIALAQISELVRSRGVTIVSPGPTTAPLPQGLRWVGRAEDLVSTYQTHELLVLPSRQEGLGIVAFEALACGTPVVAWRCGGPDRFLEESGGGVLVEDALQFQVAVESLLDDPQRREKMGLTGRDYVEKHFSGQRFLDDPTVFGSR